jgi:hypothetical protein
MHKASKVVSGTREKVQEHGLGYRKIEPEDIHRFGSGKLDRDLRRAYPEFCEEPSPRVHRARRRGSGIERRPMAIYALGFDSAGDVVSKMHALS